MENFLQMSLECTKEVCQHLIIKSNVHYHTSKFFSILHFRFTLYELNSQSFEI